MVQLKDSFQSNTLQIGTHGEVKLSDYGLPCVKAYNQQVVADASGVAWTAPEILLYSTCTQLSDIYRCLFLLA